MRDLTNKRVLVTGAAGGIGRETSMAFARAGAEIVLTDLAEEQAGGVAEEIRSAGGKASAYALDVTDPAALTELRERIHDEAGPVDVIVNNAGVVFGGSFLDVPLEKHLLTYKVNTLGLVATTHVFLPDLIGRQEGHVVNIASASGFIGLPYGTTYASSKWSVIGFSESIRLELADLGHRHVGVTAVCPSYVDTGMFDGVRPPLMTRLLTPKKSRYPTYTTVRLVKWLAREYDLAPQECYLDSLQRAWHRCRILRKLATHTGVPFGALVELRLLRGYRGFGALVDLRRLRRMHHLVRDAVVEGKIRGVRNTHGEVLYECPQCVENGIYYRPRASPDAVWTHIKVLH